jgi:hypothetical protein
MIQREDQGKLSPSSLQIKILFIKDGKLLLNKFLKAWPQFWHELLKEFLLRGWLALIYAAMEVRLEENPPNCAYANGS